MNRDRAGRSNNAPQRTSEHRGRTVRACLFARAGAETHRGSAAEQSVRMHVKQLATAILFAVSAHVSVAGATSCMGPGEGLSRFIEQSVQDSERVLLVKVTSVSEKARSSQHKGPSATVEVLKSLKGTGPISTVETSWLGGVSLRSGDTRVLFTDGAGLIVPCTEYRPWLTEVGVVLEVERIVKRRAT